MGVGGGWGDGRGMKCEGGRGMRVKGLKGVGGGEEGEFSLFYITICLFGWWVPTRKG